MDDFSNKVTLLEHCDDDDRRGFIKKVYALLTVMLGISFGSVTYVKFNPEMEASLIAEDNGLAMGAFYGCLILQLIINCAVICVKACARKVPTNYILMTMFTGCWAYILTYLCAFYDKDTVLCAALMTVVLTVALTVFALVTKIDFTELCGPWVCLGLLMILCVQLLLSILSMWIFTFT